MMRRLIVLLILTLAACAPKATLEGEAPAAFAFRQTPEGDLALVANRPIFYGHAEVAGLDLVLDSDYCDPCISGPDNYIRLTFPQEPTANYSDRIEIPVVSGEPIKGRAWATLEGEEVSRPATLTLQ